VLHRMSGVLVTAAGVAALAILVLAGVDVYRAARTGPRWRRRLVGAGLALLVALGLAPVTRGDSAEGAAAVATEEEKAPEVDLTARIEWQRLTNVWCEAEEVGAGRRGLYPFNEADKKSLLARLPSIEGEITVLERAGCLSAVEAAVLRADLPRLVAAVRVMRPTEDRMATCYEPVVYQPARDSLQRLSDRLAILDRLAESRSFHAEVVYKVLGTIEADLAVLGDDKLLAGLEEDERPEAVRVRTAVRAVLWKIRTRLEGEMAVRLLESPQWTTISAAWEQAEPLAKSGRSTAKERKAVDAALAAADAAARNLAAKMEISVPEAELIIARNKDLKTAIYHRPAVDDQVKCYDGVDLPPAEVSLDHLRDRLPLLRQLAERGGVRPRVIARLLPSLEADFETLRRAANRKELDKDDQIEAESQIIPQVERMLKVLKAFAEAKE